VTAQSQESVAREPGPTLDDIRKWPATINVDLAADALGVSRAHAYECIKAGTFPARSLQVGRRTKVITSSILALLEGDDRKAGV
jgi:predicted DNA-binding transcriptional regulator AlpA